MRWKWWNLGGLVPGSGASGWNRVLDAAEFLDDEVDAGEIGADHRVTAIYEVKLGRCVGRELGAVQVRSMPAETRSVSEAIELRLDITRDVIHSDWRKASRDFQMAVMAATFAELLRERPHVPQGVTYAHLGELARAARRLEYEEDGELIEMIRRAGALTAP